MKAIYLKEVKSFFNSVLGYAYCAVLIILIGIYFLANNLSGGYPYFSYALANASAMMMMVMPLLTMRSFSEEMKSRTDQMLLTNPITVTQIVMGKFFAYTSVYAVPLLVSCICPLIIKVYGESSGLLVDYVTIFFMLVYGLIFIAIGLFISSMTENQIVSAIISFASVFLIVMWSGLLDFIPSTVMAIFIALLIIFAVICAILYAVTKSGMITGIVAGAGFCALLILNFAKQSILTSLYNSISEIMDFTTPITNAAYYNIFDVAGLVKYITVIFIFIMLTIQGINKRRWN